MLLSKRNIIAPRTTKITIELDPVPNLLNSIGALDALDSNPGLDAWVERTAAALPPETMRLQMILFYFFGVEAMLNLITQPTDISDLAAYIDLLEDISPDELRDQLLDGAFTHYGYSTHLDYEPMPEVDRQRILYDHDYWMAYVEDMAREKDFGDLSLFNDAYALFTDPPTLKNTLLGFLRQIWQNHLADEWQRIRPILQDSVNALREIDIRGLPIFEAIQQVTGRDLRGILQESKLLNFDTITLVPSRHNGPYITTLANQNTLWLLFGARLPAQLRRGQSPLDHAELLNRLGAMGDEARLNILLALHRSGEMGTAEIMQQFDLNKSAASRHLRNLHASGLIIERRDSDGKGKFYSLDAEGLAEMLNTIQVLLG